MRTRHWLLLSTLALAPLAPVAAHHSPAMLYDLTLEITVTGIERTATVGLKDCPPGANSIRGLTKPGEEFAVVNMSFKVTPAFKETIVKKPVLLDVSGKTFQTAMSFIDPHATPQYSCGFAYRVPTGTKLGKIQIDTTTIDLTAFDK